MTISRPLRLPLIAALAGLAGLAGPALAQKIGVNSAVNPEANGSAPGAGSRQLVIGQEVVHNEHVVTGPAGQSQILFLDESAMTVGPNSDLTIDNFVYDPATGKGQLAMNATAGVLRFVGGKLSKNEDQVTLKTPSATIGIRGGVFLVNLAKDGLLDVVFLYGKGMTVTGGNITQTITRPGFAVSVARPGAAPSAPAAAPPNMVAATLGQLNGKAGKSGGSTNPPSEASVAASGVSNTISGNVAASVQQATQTAGTTAPPAVNVGTVQNNTQQNNVSVQGDSAVASAQQSPTAPGSSINNGPTTAGPIKGGFKDQVAPGTAGFNNTGVTPFTATLQNGVLSATATDSDFTFSLSPLTPGQTTNASAPASSEMIAAGPATTTADGNFFFVNAVNTSNPTRELVFFFGGNPVNQNFFAANLPAAVTAFNLQPDYALANGTQQQTIPFLPSNFGGTSANASVSPFFITTGANSPFGNTSQSSFVSPKFLQASLAFNGLGANQTSAFVVSTGTFFTFTGSGQDPAVSGQVVAGGPVRGTVMVAANQPAVRIGSAVSSVSGGDGVNLFGGDTLSGFVLDQNRYSFGGDFNTQLATASQFGQTAASYAFNQPATATALPAAATGNRVDLNEAGFFGGLVAFSGNTNTAGNPYVLTGVTAVSATTNNNRVAATFVGTDPFTPNQSGINTAVLNFGDVTGGTNSSRGTYVNSNVYGATDSPITASTINGNALALPPNSTTATPSPSLAMVTSGTVPTAIQSLLATGVTPCSCQFLQWGYWTGTLPSTTSQGLGVNRTDAAFTNTWLAGQPTVTMPTTGVGTFTGAAVGTVFNNGATYNAAGGFNQTYNFASRVGGIDITNFDGSSYFFNVSGSGNQYAGGLTSGPANRTGAVVGGFFGPNAVETGGGFGISSTAGPKYLASGIFAGR